MIFKEIERFSPIRFGKDVPHERDLFWIDPQEIPIKVDPLQKFLKKFIIDKQWWDLQRTRCTRGYIVRNAVEFGKGDVFEEGKTMFQQDDGSWYIPHLDYSVNANGDIWISGRMYFYLNFWKISIEDKLLHKKDYDHPWFTDLSWENWMLRERARREFKDIGWFKSRQRGLSEEEACDTGWVFLFMNNVQVGIGATQDVYNDNTFAMVKRGIKNIYNTQFHKEISRDNDSELITRHTGVEIYSRTAKNNPEIFSGLNKLYKVHYEEVGVMPEGFIFRMTSAVKRSITTGGTRRTGFQVFTGTAGLSDEGIRDIEEMLYKPDEHDLLSIPNTFDKDAPAGSRIACYIPAWKFRIMDENNNSLRGESIEDIYSSRKLCSPKERATLTAQEPIQTKDMFGIQPGGFFGEFISFHCSEARNRIITHAELREGIELGKLHPKNPRNLIEGVEWELDMDDGDIMIAEHPKTKEIILPGKVKKEVPLEGLYKQGTDSIDQTESNTSESKLASLVYKGVNLTVDIYSPEVKNNFVACYIGRPTEKMGGRNIAYANAAMLSLYYGCFNMIEYTKILIFEYFIDMGLEGYLAPCPEMTVSAYIDRSQVTNRYGLPSSLILPMLTKLRDFLGYVEPGTQYPINIYGNPFEMILDKFGKFKKDPKYNCDITSAAACVMALIEEYKIQDEKPREDQRRSIKTFKGFKQVNGRIVEIYA